MAFETFSLADVLNNAEIINSRKRQSNLELLRGASVREGILSSRQGRQIASSKEGRESTEFNEKTQFDNTSFLVSATDQIIASDDPIATSRLFLPEAKRRGIILDDVDVSDGLDIDEIKQINVRAKLALVKSPLAGSAQSRFFDDLTEGLTPEELREAQDIQLGLQARAGTTSARERIATDDELTENIAESEATIRERVKFAELTGSSRSKLIDKGFESIRTIDKNVRNLDRAISALNEGASTGAIESRFFPTIREATVKLEQVQGELALDVVGAVTFGALSKGELDLARSVALPAGLQPPALIEFLQDKKAAQGKLRTYYSEQIDFLDQGGSIAGFLRSKERNNRIEGSSADTALSRDSVQQTTGGEAPEGTIIQDNSGQQLIKEGGLWVPVNAN